MSPRIRALLIPLAAIACSPAQPAERGRRPRAVEQVPAARVESADAAGRYRAAGTVRAARRAELATRLMGRVETVRVRAGDRCGRGSSCSRSSAPR